MVVQRQLIESAHVPFIMGFQGSVAGMGAIRWKSFDSHPLSKKGLTADQLSRAKGESRRCYMHAMYDTRADFKSVSAKIKERRDQNKPGCWPCRFFSSRQQSGESGLEERDIKALFATPIR